MYNKVAFSFAVCSPNVLLYYSYEINAQQQSNYVVTLKTFFARCSMLLIVRKRQDVVCHYSAVHMETDGPNRCSRIDRQSVMVVADSSPCPSLRKETKSLSWRRCRHSVAQSVMVKTHLRWPLKDTESLTIPATIRYY